jgi:hydroxymethylpyrimidine/phosphomethylpyrimidine kinase
MEIVLTIAGSDPSGGAGIQQDLKVITAHGCYGATVITALTSQNTRGVQSSMPVPPEVVASQLQSVLSDLHLSAVKIGMIPNKAVAQVIVEALKTVAVPIIYDPVMISTSGYELMTPDAITYIADHLFPLCTLVTPNLPEAKRLQDRITHPQTAFLIKGGHADSMQMTDRLIMPDGTVSEFTTEKIASRNLHGTGCTLSSAIASNMALGNSLPKAISQAKEFITAAIRRSANISIGHGNGPLHPFLTLNS